MVKKYKWMLVKVRKKVCFGPYWWKDDSKGMEAYFTEEGCKKKYWESLQLKRDITSITDIDEYALARDIGKGQLMGLPNKGKKTACNKFGLDDILSTLLR